jgi:hypothetical protein
MGVDRVQRFSAANPCPICNGYDEAARGNGARCFGFLSDDGRYSHCSREEYAGTLERNATSATYCHYLGSGTCRCGKEHSGPISAHTAANSKAETKRRANFEQPKDTVYFYRLASGEAIYAAIRFGGKKPSYPAYKKDGVWWLGTPEDYSPIPYNLPGVMQAALEGKPVHIFEGESDVEVAKKIGLYATTNMMGSGKFMEELVPHFRGLDVRINQDNDAPGKAHALDLAHKLFGTAKSIKVIPPFPGVPEGGDFKDWIAAGGTKEEYLRIVDETSIQNSDETPRGRGEGFVGILPFKSVGDVFKETDEEIPWVVGGLLATGNITEISGTAKLSGKTTLLLDIASCLLEGQPLLDIPTVRSNVAFLTEQGNNLKEALEIASISPDTKGLHILQYKDVRGRKWAEIAEQVCEYCKQNDIGVLIVDTLVEFGQIEDENLVGPVRESMQNLKKAAQNYGLAVAYTRHHNKQNQGRGSSQFEADCDFYFTLKRPEGNHKDTVRVLHGEGRSRDRIKNLYIELQEGGYVALDNEHGDNLKFKAAVRTIKGILPSKEENAKERPVVIDLLKDAGHAKTTVNEALRWMVDNNIARSRGRGVKGDPERFWLPLQNSDETLPDESDSLEDKSPANQEANIFGRNLEGRGEEFRRNNPKEQLAQDHPSYVHTEKRAKECLRWVIEVPEVAIDTETYGRLKRDGLLYTKGTIRLIQLHHGDTTWFIDCDAVEDGLVAAILKELEDKPKYFHNALFNVPRLHRRFGVLLKEHVHDTMIASRVARAGEWTTKNHKVVKIEHSLEECLKRERGITLSKDRKLKWDTRLTREHLEYARDDVVLLKVLYETLLEVLKERRVEERYAVIVSTLPVFIEATVRGVPLDAQRLETALEEIEKEKVHLKSRLDELAPEHPEGLPWV